MTPPPPHQAPHQAPRQAQEQNQTPHQSLRRALNEPGLRPLPDEVAALLIRLDAPPRLAAHLRAVHDVACRLIDGLGVAYPGLEFDREATRFGAATHDIGKVLYPEELSEPGARHEPAGYELLLAYGVNQHRARFARDHATWAKSGLGIEDLLVSLADKVWKAKRVKDLEDGIVEVLRAATGEPQWQAFMTLDDIITPIAADADIRLAFQSHYPASDSPAVDNPAVDSPGSRPVDLPAPA